MWPALHALPFRTDYYRNLRKLSFRNVESIVFDQMLPHIAHYWTRDEMTTLVRPLEALPLLARAREILTADMQALSGG